MSKETSRTNVEDAPNEPSMDFDEYSGKTLMPEYTWKQATKKKPHNITTNGNQIKESEKPGSNIKGKLKRSKSRPRANSTSEEKADGRSRSRSRRRHQQQQEQNVSCAHVVKPLEAPSPDSLPNIQQQQQITKLDKMVESLKELNTKLMKLLDNWEKRPQQSVQSASPADLEQRKSRIIEQKLEQLIDQKTEQRFHQLELFFEQSLSEITSAMTAKFGKINTTIFKMGQAIDTLTNTNNLTIRLTRLIGASPPLNKNENN
ncbi:hypothetical protein HPB49_003969 [Dermacentor silvarum]|uniref:Uncharacterized protein n=1 Tax=Dermacentor silvarum TaxID=543639 RepID=A0ACB8DTV6_DERSI|nr:hypothetical protein HPB49_003969 [Dermacentor silvarum]